MLPQEVVDKLIFLSMVRLKLREVSDLVLIMKGVTRLEYIQAVNPNSLEIRSRNPKQTQTHLVADLVMQQINLSDSTHLSF